MATQTSPLQEKGSVCVTGASGFIGSWLVTLLLQRGYHVRATVENIEDKGETKHLEALEGAKTRLHLFQVNILDYETIAAAIGTSSGVFHLASPCNLDKIEDPEKILLDPAIKGTLNVLKASHAANVKRVVVTSSISSMVPNPKLPEGVVVDENCWTDVDYCKEKELWYPLSKTLAEKAAWGFAAESGLDVVCINPGCVLGPLLQPRLNASSAVLLNLLNGSEDTLTDIWLGCVHVQDVAAAHILLYETPSAKGRYLCTESIHHFSDFAQKVANLFPQYKIHRFGKDTHPELVRCANPSKKLMDLGFTFKPADVAIRDAVLSLQKKGFLKH